ncbi:MAG: EVE domain-containing protein [Ignavibacteriales bacterium]|nr:EVE domain-containing protein [Ignavibacteriales bacterium]
MLEKDIENLIASHPDEFFPSCGFKLIGQQIKLGRCFADIIFEDRFSRKVIVEVKRGILSRDASGQVMEYYGLLKNEQPEVIIELILCANVIPVERKKFLETVGIECKELGINSINTIAAKYNYRFLDSEHKESIAQTVNISSIPETERVWIFQANPRRYDILNALSDEKIGSEIHWLVNQHRNEISKGHLGIIWLSGSDGGIYALTEIISNPQFMREPEDEDKYWIDSSDKGEEKLRVKMKVLKNLVNIPIYKNEIRNTVGLENISIFRQSQGTNFPLTTDEWRLIKNIIYNHNT